LTADDLGAKYARVRDRYESLAAEIAKILRASFGTVVHAQLEFRAKDIDAFEQKAVRPGKSYEDPLIDITDLAGVRVIARSTDQLAAIRERIYSEFEVDKARSVDKIDELGDDQFGYLSTHFIVRLKDPRTSQPEYAGLTGLFAEIQVRTVAQHAWAQFSRFLLYETAADIPKPLRRRAFALAALFEVADHELDALLREGTDLVRQSTRDIEDDASAVPLEVESLTAYLLSSPIAQAWVNDIQRIGVGVGDVGLVSRDVEMARRADITTIAELDKVLRDAAPWRAEYLLAFYRNSFRSIGFDDPGQEDFARLTTDRNAIIPLVLIATFPYVFTAQVLDGDFGFGDPERALDAAAVVRRKSQV
jgi:putative GTP pyrophosphokinase